MTEAEKRGLRESIDAEELIRALRNHALGEEKKKMSATQVSAAIALLKKKLPDLPGSAGASIDEAMLAHEAALRELE
jgi:hypothetical protein